jgi:hypothetical protein
MTRASLTTMPDASGPPVDPAMVASAALRARLTAVTSSGATAPGTPDLFTPTDGDRP